MAKRKGNDIDRSIAAGNTGGRAVAGTSYALGRIDDRSGKEFDAGKMVKREGGKGKGGTVEPAMARHKGQVMQDRLGPRFAIGAKMPGPQAPEAALTQRNTIFMRSAVNRSLPNFNLGRMG